MPGLKHLVILLFGLGLVLALFRVFSGETAPLEPVAAVQALTEGNTIPLARIELGQDVVHGGPFFASRPQMSAFTELQYRVALEKPRITYKSDLIQVVAVSARVKEAEDTPTPPVYFRFVYADKQWRWIGSTKLYALYQGTISLHGLLTATGSSAKRHISDLRQQLPDLPEDFDFAAFQERVKDNVSFLASDDRLRDGIGGYRDELANVAKLFLQANIPELTIPPGDPAPAAADADKPGTLVDQARELQIFSFRRLGTGALIRLTNIDKRNPQTGIFVWYTADASRQAIDSVLLGRESGDWEGVVDLGDGWFVLRFQ